MAEGKVNHQFLYFVCSTMGEKLHFHLFDGKIVSEWQCSNANTF